MILEDELKRVKIDLKEKRELIEITRKIVNKIEERLKNKKIDAKVFIGGSLAKDTILRKDSYDIDIFVRFGGKYSEKDIEKNMGKIFFLFNIKGLKLKIKKLHGSRDYYQIKLKNSNIIVEVVPTLFINKPEEARNVTDLSYFHVKYIKERIKKNKRLADDIILAKAFCHAQKVYGAESYVKGFSGYTLELLVCHYYGFIKFLNEIVNSHGQIIVDPGKKYASKKEVLDCLNKAKTQSPIVIVDPTFKDRNVASSLSKETFDKFKVSAKAFLEKPSIDFFEPKKIIINDLIRKAKIEEATFVALELITNKQEGDVAGTKMLKFSKIMSRELERYVDVLEEHFDYNGSKKSIVYYILRKKNELILEGPSLEHKEAVENFKKVHPIWFIESKRIKCAQDTNIKIEDIIKNYIKKNKRQMKEMGIKKIKIV